MVAGLTPAGRGFAGRGVFVTGTDTGVGKTVAAAALAAWAAARGRDVGVMKPVATGASARGARIVSGDARLLARASRSADPWPLITPCVFREPLAPLTAASRAGRPIGLRRILSAYRAMSERHSTLIVEGVGGLYVPLARGLMVSDLARAMGLPVIVVARLRLGTLNHTLMTLSCAREAGLAVAGVIFSAADNPSRGRWDGVVEKTNIALIREWGRARVLGVLPYAPECRSASLSVRADACRDLSRFLESKALAKLL